MYCFGLACQKMSTITIFGPTIKAGVGKAADRKIAMYFMLRFQAQAYEIEHIHKTDWKYFSCTAKLHPAT